MHEHAWTYNNIEIIIKINILLTDLNLGHYSGWAKEEGCLGSPDKFWCNYLIYLTQYKFEKDQRHSKSCWKSDRVSPIPRTYPTCKRVQNALLYPQVTHPQLNHITWPLLGPPKYQQPQFKKLQFSPYNYHFLQKLPIEL